MKRKLYQAIASKLTAMANCGNIEWLERHEAAATALAEHLPSGSGFDRGSFIDFEASKPNKLVIITSYHHMENGFYVGWTEHKIIVTPSLANGFDIRVTGRDRNGIKDYIGEVFHSALAAEVDDYFESADLEDRINLKVRQLADALVRP